MRVLSPERRLEGAKNVKDNIIIWGGVIIGSGLAGYVGAILWKLTGP